MAASNVFLSYVTHNKSINCLETTEKTISNLTIALQIQTTPDLVSASIGITKNNNSIADGIIANEYRKDQIFELRTPKRNPVQA